MRPLISLLVIIFTLSLTGFFLIFFFLPPKVGGELVQTNLIYFFTSLFLSLALGLSLMLYSASFGLQKLRGPKLAIRSEINRPKILFRSSLRRGVLFAVLVCLLLLFRLLNIFNILNLVLLLAIVGIVEFYFSNR